MSWHRIRMVVLHSWYHLHHSMETFVDLFYTSVLQTLVFGLIALYFAQRGSMQGAVIVMGLIFWQVVNAAQYSVSIGMMWEVWSRSFSTLFISPLTMTEFFVGQMIFSLFKSMLSAVMVAVVVYWMYGFSVLELGWWLPIYFVELMIFGWAVGLFVNGLIMRFGIDIQSFAWGVLGVFQPISAVFFPVTVLPKAWQFLAWRVPLTYFFEAARGQLQGVYYPEYLVYGSLLNIVYLVLGYVFLRSMHARGKRTGAFARMEG